MFHFTDNELEYPKGAAVPEPTDYEKDYQETEDPAIIHHHDVHVLLVASVQNKVCYGNYHMCQGDCVP